MAELDKDPNTPGNSTEENEQKTGRLSPDLNPFSGSDPIAPKTAKRLGLGGTLGAGLEKPAPKSDKLGGIEDAASKEVVAAAKEVAGFLADAFVADDDDWEDPEDIDFPKMSDTKIINEVLKEIEQTPLMLGYNTLEHNSDVMDVWKCFIRNLCEDYREKNEVEKSTLVPVEIHIPDWIKYNPSFDILAGFELMQIDIYGEVKSNIAGGVNLCKVTFHDKVHADAVVGRDSETSTFIFEEPMSASKSFENANNLSLHFKSDHLSGDIGPIEESKIVCEGEWAGRYRHKGPKASHDIGKGINTIQG